MGSDTKKIAYLLHNERPMSGLVRGQVMAMLAEVKRMKSDYKITVIAVWQPWVYVSYKDKIDRMRDELASHNIDLESKPLAFLPSRYFMYDHRTLPFFNYFYRIIFRFLGLHRFDLVHSRSYFPSHVVSQLKKRYGYRSIFDMRSLFPEEVVTIGKWAIGSAIYNLWKEYEKVTVEQSDAFTAVSNTMKADADKISPGLKADLITLSVDTKKICFDAQERTRVRKEYGWEGKYVIAYLGSLAFERQWNNIYNYAEYYKRMVKYVPHAHMLFIIPEYNDGFHDVLESYGITKDMVTFEEGTSKLNSLLSAADSGIHVMSKGPDSHTRLGVKITEYLSCGLPVVTNSNVGAAAEFVEANNVGIRLDLDDSFGKKISAFTNSVYSRDKCTDIACKNFSIERISGQYLNLYQRLLRG